MILTRFFFQSQQVSQTKFSTAHKQVQIQMENKCRPVRVLGQTRGGVCALLLNCVHMMSLQCMRQFFKRPF